MTVSSSAQISNNSPSAVPSAVMSNIKAQTPIVPEDNNIKVKALNTSKITSASSNSSDEFIRSLSKLRSKECRRRQYKSTLIRNDAAMGFQKRSIALYFGASYFGQTSNSVNGQVRHSIGVGISPSAYLSKNCDALLNKFSVPYAKKTSHQANGRVEHSTKIETPRSASRSQNSQNSNAASLAAYAPSFRELLFDWFSMAAYFVASEFADLYVATAIAIGTTVLQMIWQQTQYQQIDFVLWIELAALIVTGGVGFFLSPFFVKLKPTIFNILMSGALLLSEWFGKNGLIKNIWEGEIKNLSEDNWAKLSWSFAGFSVGLGALNALIAYTCSNRIWVLFALLGTRVSTVFFLEKQFAWAKVWNAYAANNSNIHIHDAKALA